jgi:hypothetical protein
MTTYPQDWGLVTDLLGVASSGKERAPLPTARWFTHRYLTDRLTAEEIGELCGWSSQYIRDRLRDHGIRLRPPGTHHRIRQ